MVYGEDKQLLQSFFVSGGFVEINPEKCIVLAEEVFEMVTLDKSAIEQQMQDLENETGDESIQQYAIAKSKEIVLSIYAASASSFLAFSTASSMPPTM